MPPRRSARVAAAAEQRAWAFPQLPLPLALRIFSLLPADQRLRCAEVCRAWRATVALPALWRRLDLSPASGVAFHDLAALLRAAVARAGGALKELEVSDTNIGAADLCRVLRSSAGSVDEIHRSDTKRPLLGVQSVTALLAAAAPRLRELRAGVCCTVEQDVSDATKLLEGRPSFAPLRVRSLCAGAHTGALPPTLARALADARLQPGLSRLMLNEADLRPPSSLDAVVDAIVARRRLRQLIMFGCMLSPAVIPALARAVCDGALTSLKFINCGGTFLDAAGGATLGDALRANSTS